MLSRDTILAKNDVQTEEVEVPEWGGSVLVRGMSGTEREAFEKARTREVPSGNRNARRAGQTTTEFSRERLRAGLVCACAVDERGNRLFTTEDLPALNDKSAAALERIVDVAMRLSGMDNNEIEKLAEEMAQDPFGETFSPSPES